MNDSDEVTNLATPGRLPADYFYPDGEEGDRIDPPGRRPNAARCIVDAAVDAVLTQEARTRLQGGAVAVVVRVPSPSWVEPVGAAFERINGGFRIFARDGSHRTLHKSDVGNDDVAEKLASGRTVVGIAPSIGLLPRSLTAAADLTLEIGIDANIIGRAIQRFVGCSGAVDRIDAPGTLDLHDIVSAFRAGSAADEIVERLRRSAGRLNSPRDDKLPRLVDAIEYGPAREWGLALGRDVDDYRAGRVAWSDVRANALFGGEPGLGKTYFARVVAAHLGIPLIATSISELFATSAGYLDSVIKALRDVFARAEASAPAAILLDELDALPSRGSLNDRNASWWTPVIADLLLLLDSASNGNRKMVFVWAATNHPSRIDPALLRPGRLDQTILFAPPGAEGIVSIARHHLDGALADVDLTDIGHLGLGRSPAVIAAAVKTAKGAARAERRALAYDDLVDALAPRADVDAATLRRVALHEAGHAVLAIELGVDEVVAVDVVASTSAFGRTMMRRRDGVETRATIENRTIAQLGGRAAEAVFYDNDCSANAGGDDTSDLAMATEAITSLRVSMGLGDGGGLAYLGDPEAAVHLLRLDSTLRAAVDRDLARLFDRALTVVRRRSAAIEATASALAERRHLAGDAVRRIVADHPPVE